MLEMGKMGAHYPQCKNVESQEKRRNSAEAMQQSEGKVMYKKIQSLEEFRV